MRCAHTVPLVPGVSVAPSKLPNMVIVSSSHDKSTLGTVDALPRNHNTLFAVQTGFSSPYKSPGQSTSQHISQHEDSPSNAQPWGSHQSPTPPHTDLPTPPLSQPQNSPPHPSPASASATSLWPPPSSPNTLPPRTPHQSTATQPSRIRASKSLWYKSQADRC